MTAKENITAHQKDTLAPLGISVIEDFIGARSSSRPKERLEEVRQRAVRFRERMLAGTPVEYFQSVDIVSAPYPTKYAYLNAVKSLVPFIFLGNRAFIIQFQTSLGKKTLLFGPADVEGNTKTPFFKLLTDKMGRIGDMTKEKLLPFYSSVEVELQKAGIPPESIDYISYDHLHTQELRKWMGSSTTPGYFPNAKLLVMRQEWESAQDLLVTQKKWYCPDGTRDIPAERVILLDNSVMLGDGVALVQTPGHTEGNHSLVVHVNDQIYVSSENGMSVDSYAPLQSNIPGVRKYAEQFNMEIILNGNTLENSIDQYISMVMEKTIAGPNPDHPGFFNVISSSEQAHTWHTRTVQPAFRFGQMKVGQYQS